MYIIFGRYNGETEEVDQASTKQEAEYLVQEYRLAFGPGWQIWKRPRFQDRHPPGKDVIQ